MPTVLRCFHSGECRHRHYRWIFNGRFPILLKQRILHTNISTLGETRINLMHLILSRLQTFIISHRVRSQLSLAAASDRSQCCSQPHHTAALITADSDQWPWLRDRVSRCHAALHHIATISRCWSLEHDMWHIVTPESHSTDADTGPGPGWSQTIRCQLLTSAGMGLVTASPCVPCVLATEDYNCKH